MKIKDVEVGNVFGASGIMNFHGEGYPYHKYLKIALLLTPFWVPLFRVLRMIPAVRKDLKEDYDVLSQLILVSNEIPFYPIWFSTKGMVLITKTIVVDPRDGNMEMKEDNITPKDFQPSCIYVDMPRQSALNNVSLTCPGFKALLEMGKLQAIKGPFIISFMPVGTCPKGLLDQVNTFMNLFLAEKKYFIGKPILQLNISCPNTGHTDLNEYLEQLKLWVGVLRFIGIPITVKMSIHTPKEAIPLLVELFDALFVSNTVPFDSLSKEEKLEHYGTETSPLHQYQDEFKVKGNGGVSGRYLLEPTLQYIRDLRKMGISIPIIMGGGILEELHVRWAKTAGADGISPGSITMIKPWNLPEVIRTGNCIFT